MYDLILENKTGNRLEFEMGSPFQVVEITGLNPPPATINTAEIAYMDGSRFTGSKLQARAINAAFAIQNDAAENRIEVYRVLKSKQPVRLIYKSLYRNIYIDGWIESIDITYFEMVQVVTCVIICPDPYLKNAEELATELSDIVGMFHFPFASTEEPEIVFGYIGSSVSVFVPNGGDVETGLVIELYARDTVSDPKIFDVDSQEWLKLNVTMQPGDMITVDTRQGHKTVTLLRNGTETSLFYTFDKGSSWLQLAANGSSFVYEVGSGDPTNLFITFKHNNLYEGV